MRVIAVWVVSFVVAYFFLKIRKQNFMKLSENFSLGEFLKTSTGLFNEPTEGELKNLKMLVINVLQPFRNRVGRLDVTSGFRSHGVNEAVGGVEGSAHTQGLAADIIPASVTIEDAFQTLKEMRELPIRKAILEEKGGSKWIHISVDRESIEGFSKPKRQFLTAVYNKNSKKMDYNIYG